MKAILKGTFIDKYFDPETGLYYYGARYLGDTRIVTKLNSGENPTYQEESRKQYYYHSDHLGSASLISDYQGDEYQRLEYTPYGETWVEKTQNTGLEYLPYKFTAKELDEETGLYYYGARYLDPKYSMWISTDPALGEYMSGSSAGCGGAYNSVNLNLYHYAGNNPVRYTDPTGMWIDNEDGTYTAEEGDTLHGLYGDDWQEKSGFTRDPTTLQVGETVGAKNTSKHSQEKSQGNEQNSSPEQKAHHLRDGLLEIGAGIAILVLTGIEVRNIMLKDPKSTSQVGYGGVLAGATIIAAGITRASGASKTTVKEDFMSLLESPLGSAVREFNNSNANGKGRAPGRTVDFSNKNSSKKKEEK